MKLFQVNQFFLLALGAKEQEVLKNGIFPNPHTGFSVAVGAQQPSSFFVHSVHLPSVGAEINVICRVLLPSFTDISMYFTAT